MREIKFRAWNKEKKKMFDDVEGKNNSKDPINLNAFFRNNEFEWMQYTSLMDKDGKDIYEGDIITDGIGVWYVYYAENIASFWLMDYKGYKTGHIIAENNKIIGNIYENPELLREEGKMTNSKESEVEPK